MMLMTALLFFTGCKPDDPNDSDVYVQVDGALNGKFTINDNGDQVCFSKGNLQYQASTNTWRFAENQWDFVGDDNSNISETYAGWIDLFGWGTSGYHDANDPYNVNYQPWSTSTMIVDESYNFNSYGYGPSTNMASPNLTGSSANYDWGVYNLISNGGNQAGLWRTLSHNEWYYVFNRRSTNSGIRFARAKVNNINGVILLPDDWSVNYCMLNSTNQSSASFNSNIITASQWNTLEQHGAVFLPPAGNRSGTMVSGVGSGGIYWSVSSIIIYSNRACGVHFNSMGLEIGGNYSRCAGVSVRLVRSFQ